MTLGESLYTILVALVFIGSLPTPLPERTVTKLKEDGLGVLESSLKAEHPMRNSTFNLMVFLVLAGVKWKSLLPRRLKKSFSAFVAEL